MAAASAPVFATPRDAIRCGADNNLLSLPFMVQAMMSGNMAMRVPFATPGVTFKRGSNRNDTKEAVRMLGALVHYFGRTRYAEGRLMYLLRVYRNGEFEVLMIPSVHGSMRQGSDTIAQEYVDLGVENYEATRQDGFFHLSIFGSSVDVTRNHYLISIPTALVELVESTLGWDVSVRWDFMRRLLHKGIKLGLISSDPLEMPTARDVAKVLTNGTKFCSWCKKEPQDLDPGMKLRRCRRCQTYSFCSPECMLASWKRGQTHRETCQEAPEGYVPCMTVHDTNVRQACGM